MSLLKTLGLGVYYRIRRMKKALKNWRRFGVIIFGSLFLASSFLTNSAVAQGAYQVAIYPTNSEIQLGQSKLFTAQAFMGTQKVTDESTITWLVSKGGTTLSSSTGSSLAYTPGETGTYTIKARGDHSGGAMAWQNHPATLVVTGTNPDPDPPVGHYQVSIYPTYSEIELGQSKLYTAQAFLGTNNVTSQSTITWVVSKSSTSVMTTTGSQFNYTPSATGTYTVKARGDHTTSSSTVWQNDAATLVVTTSTPPVNQPPIARITVTPSYGDAPLYVTLNASHSSDSDGWIINYEWDWEGDGIYDYNSGYDSIVSHIYSSSGIYSPRVRVMDNDWATAVASASVVATIPYVENQPPVAALSPSPSSGMTPLNVLLNASGSYDPDGVIVSYAWDYDGNGVYDYSTTSSTTIHTYGAGSHYPRVRVTDNHGAIAVASTYVYVQDIYIQEEYLVGVDGWAADSHLYNYESTSLSAHAWSNLRNLPDATYYWEKLNGVGYLSGNIHSQYGARFNANNVAGSVNIRVTAYWGGNSVSDTLVIYVNDIPVPPPPPPVPTPIYTSFVGIVEGGGTACDNDIIQYTIKLGNFNQNLISGVQLTMGIPTYTTFLSASSATDHPRLSGGQIVWDAGTLYTNDIETLIVRVMLNDNIPAVGIQGSAYVTSDQNPGFTIKSNIIYTCGATGGPTEPLTPTGVDWQILAILAAISLVLTTLTYGYLRYRADRVDIYS